jgi:transposase
MGRQGEGSQIPSGLREQMAPEVLAFVEGLLSRIGQLEARLRKNPQNSSLPPSTLHPHAKPKPRGKPSGRKRGGQKGHPKHERALVPPEEVTETIPLRPAHCRSCGGELSGDDPQPLRHQVFELPEIKPIITEYQRHRLTCPCCGVQTAAALPDGVGRGQSGPRLTAFVALLMASFRQSKRRTALFVETVLNIPCSAAWTVKLQNLATKALRPCYEELRELLPRSDAVWMDETPTKQANRKVWLWTALTKRFTVFAVRLSRAAEVPKELLGEKYSGVVTSDRYAGYDWIDKRQLCCGHLLRDFQSLIDSGHRRAKQIGTRLKDSFQELFHHWHDYREGRITHRAMRGRIRKLQWPVYEALEAGTLKLRGKPAGMCQHILDRFDHLWTFLDHAGVEPTNNASERALRHGVIWRKLSFGTQSASGSRFVETLLSVIETCRQQGHNVIHFITQAVDAHFNARPAPSLGFSV